MKKLGRKWEYAGDSVQLVQMFSKSIIPFFQESSSPLNLSLLSLQKGHTKNKISKANFFLFVFPAFLNTLLLCLSLNLEALFNS